MYVAFDRDFARSQGIPTRLISYTMSALIAVTIVLSIRIMGIVLLISLLTIPVTIVNTFTKSFRTLAPAAAAVAVAGNLAGLALSYNFEVFARCGYNIYPDRYAYFSKTANFARITIRNLSDRLRRTP